jgi:opacity protein-like surface antigen
MQEIDMRFVAKVALGAVALALTGSTAMAADLMAPPPPATAMTSGWDGVYIGANGYYDLDGYAGVQGVLGVNATISDNFLIGGELALGPYFGVGANSGQTGSEDYLAARAGIVSGPALIYAMGGLSNIDSDVGGVVGAGVEFSVADNVSVRVQAVDYLHADFSQYFQQVSAGLMFHFK